MDFEKQYKKLQNWVASRLGNKFHDRHLEDCVQHIAMQCFEHGDWEKYGLSGRWDWYLANYCRDNGLNSNNKSKVSARTLEVSTFVGFENDENEDKSENYFLLHDESIARSEAAERSFHEEDTIKGVIEELLAPLNLNNEVMKWVTENYKVKKSYKERMN